MVNRRDVAVAMSYLGIDMRDVLGVQIHGHTISLKRFDGYDKKENGDVEKVRFRFEEIRLDYE